MVFCELEASLVYKNKVYDCRNYTEKSCLNNKKRERERERKKKKPNNDKVIIVIESHLFEIPYKECLALMRGPWELY